MAAQETVKNKIRKLYVNNNNNDIDIETKTNDDNKNGLDESFLKKPIVLHDTGDISLPVASSQELSVDTGTLLPVTRTYQYDHNIDIKSCNIPFINFSGSFSSSVGTEFASTHSYLSDTLVRSGHIFTMDDEIVWNGSHIQPLYHTISSQGITDGIALASHCEPAWFGTIRTTTADYEGIQYTGFHSLYYDVVTESHHTSKSWFFGTINGDDHFPQKGEFISIGTSLTVKGCEGHEERIETQDTNGYWHWTETYTYTPDLTKTFTLSELSYIKIYNPNNNTGATIAPTTITFISGSQHEYNVFWDSAKRYYFHGWAFTSAGSPVIWGPSGPGSPVHNTIRYSMSEFYLGKRSELYGTDKITNSALAGDTYDPFWIRQSKSTDNIETWKVVFDINGLTIQPSTEPMSGTGSYKVVIYLAYTYNDIAGNPFWEFPASGTVSYVPYTYTQYGVQDVPVSARVIASYCDPTYYKKTSKFNTNRS